MTTATILRFDPVDDNPARWLSRPVTRQDARLRMFCFPWSGAGASAYRPLANELPADIEAVTVQLPGRGDRRDETASGRLVPLARQVARAVRTELARRPGPFAFFGHSFGALLAFEVAQRVEAAGLAPELVVLSGSRAPALPPPVVLHALDDRDLLAALGRMGGMGSSRMRDPEFLDYFLPLVRADLTACETYRPVTGSLRCPMSAWSGSDDWYARPVDVTRWRQFAGRRYRDREFDGGHFYTSDTALVAETLLADLRWSHEKSPRNAIVRTHKELTSA